MRLTRIQLPNPFGQRRKLGATGRNRTNASRLQGGSTTFMLRWQIVAGCLPAVPQSGRLQRRSSAAFCSQAPFGWRAARKAKRLLGVGDLQESVIIGTCGFASSAGMPRPYGFCFPVLPSSLSRPVETRRPRRWWSRGESNPRPKRLRYEGITAILVEPVGIEPTTSCLQSRRSPI